MKVSASSLSGRGCGGILLLGCYHLFSGCDAYASHASTSNKFNPSSAFTSTRLTQPTPLLGKRSYTSHTHMRRSSSLKVATVEVEMPESMRGNSKKGGDNLIISLRDVVPLSIYTALCLAGAMIISTYEDFDVTHTRPSPSTLRLPTSSGKVANFLGAATQGMGSGPSNRGIQSSDLANGASFEEWYGTSATTLQWKPSYNEIMLQHRTERVPRWNELENEDVSVPAKASMGTTPATKYSVVTPKGQLQGAVLQLYQSLDELDELKVMADDYMWEEMKDLLNPTASTESKRSLQTALEYSMDVLKSMPSYYASNPDINGNTIKEVPELIGFDWGSCAWRHCGAKADAQEAVAELYGSVGMLEPYECRFIIDVVERSIRDVLVVVPDDLKPYENGALVQVKPYQPYVPRAGDDAEGLGIDYEYTQALAFLREDLSGE